MFPVSTKQGGLCQATPDTCQVPSPVSNPIPTPFPNLGDLTQANPGTVSMKVTISNQPPITEKTTLMMSSGDEGGPVGGVVSGMIKGPVAFKTASTKVKVEGSAVVYPTCVSAHNGTNANAPMGVVVAPSQVKVIVTN